ncbi:hypothetical protein Ani05nite_69690 [Amorphoplanes nipponensis]|uniref:Uncharacterized protein n=1 Tax=Actinoplanes nipponensis TaxID=135950 RepID=A0A919MXL4_9ACTN|nr:hypothetical protein [Actinoplanes nipponensis]GIE53435.1 hypothetical protein Ani05nite_69690 [Actinoplanes nipponensis]
MSSLPDAERDASEVVQMLAGLVALLRGREPLSDDDTRTLLHMALEGSISAARVLEYLRALQGSGDGAATAVPPRLGPWRDWVPPRGDLLGQGAGAPRIEQLPRHRPRHDPGE